MLEMDNIELEISDNGLGLLADLALEIGTGARGLKSLFESIMNEIVFEYSSKENTEVEKVVVNPKMIKKYLDKRFTKYLKKVSSKK